MRITLLAQANGLDSLAAILTHFASGHLSRNPHLRVVWTGTTKQSQELSTNAVTVIRTTQQNGEFLEFWERAKSGNFVRKKSEQRSAIDEVSFVVFCFASNVLQVPDDCWNTPSKMMSQSVFYSEVCYILGDGKRTIHL